MLQFQRDSIQRNNTFEININGFTLPRDPEDVEFLPRELYWMQDFIGICYMFNHIMRTRLISQNNMHLFIIPVGAAHIALWHILLAEFGFGISHASKSLFRCTEDFFGPSQVSDDKFDRVRIRDDVYDQDGAETIPFRPRITRFDNIHLTPFRSFDDIDFFWKNKDFWINRLKKIFPNPLFPGIQFWKFPNQKDYNFPNEFIWNFVSLPLNTSGTFAFSELKRFRLGFNWTVEELANQLYPGSENIPEIKSVPDAVHFISQFNLLFCDHFIIIPTFITRTNIYQLQVDVPAELKSLYLYFLYDDTSRQFLTFVVSYDFEMAPLKNDEKIDVIVNPDPFRKKQTAKKTISKPQATKAKSKKQSKEPPLKPRQKSKASAEPPSQAQPKKKSKLTSKPTIKAKPISKAKPKPTAKAKPKPKPTAKVKPKPTAKAKPKPTAKAKPKPTAKAKPKPKPKAKPKPEPKAKVKPTTIKSKPKPTKAKLKKDTEETITPKQKSKATAEPQSKPQPKKHLN